MYLATLTAENFRVFGARRSPEETGDALELELTPGVMGIFLAHLTTDAKGSSSLYISFRAELMDSLPQHRVSVTTRTGPNGEGPTLDGKAREHLKATYLRPLRDAEGELRAGRGSRLSQILAGYPTMKAEGTDDFAAGDDSASTLVGILRRAEHHIRSNKAVTAALDDINKGYLESQPTTGPPSSSHSAAASCRRRPSCCAPPGASTTECS